jgi:hypothetical protein
LDEEKNNPSSIDDLADLYDTETLDLNEACPVLIGKGESAILKDKPITLSCLRFMNYGDGRTEAYSIFAVPNSKMIETIDDNPSGYLGKKDIKMLTLHVVSYQNSSNEK